MPRKIKEKWTLKRVLREAKQIHGGLYNLDQTDEVRNYKSRLSVFCYKCEDTWHPSIGCFIEKRTGCPKCKGGVCNTSYDQFIRRAKEKYGENTYNYSAIKKEDVKTALSIVTILCKCGGKWPVSINSFLGRKTLYGCIECNQGKPWTLKRFLKEAKEIHGEKYNYSKIKAEHINGSKSKVKIICNCGNEFDQAISSHINNANGCFHCNLGKPMNFERFMKEAKEIHGDLYDYSEIKTEDITSFRSIVRVICKRCSKNWPVIVMSHINGKTGCDSCNHHHWTYNRFMVEAIITHGIKFDYSEVKEDHVKCEKSKIPITCNTCKYEFTPTISSFIKKKSGCIECTGRAPLTLEKIIIRIKAVHAEKYSCDLVKKEHIINRDSLIPIKCNLCNNIWEPKIVNICCGGGCTKCSDHMPWNIDRFYNKITDYMKTCFDYKLVKPDHFCDGATSKIPIICKKCGNSFTCRLHDHLWNLGCQNCSSTKGERICKEILNDVFGVDCKMQSKLDPYKRLKYDFEFEFNNQKWMLEFDGKQHFEVIDFFKMTEETLEIFHERDILKTNNALSHGYNVIRIDYTQMDDIVTHLKQVLNSNYNLYVTNENMYSWLLSGIDGIPE